MKKHLSILLFILTLTFPLVAQEKTNFVIIYADDLGYGDIGVYGATDIRTPNIDRLAANGLRFTSFYSTSPVCSPSRFGLLTGRYPRRQGIDHVFFPESFNGIPAGEVTLAEALKQKGYATGIVGKWHLGHHQAYLPLQNGFDEYFGIPYSNDMSGVVYLRGNQVESYSVDQRYTTRKYTEEAVRFIGENKTRPFFLYLAHNMPHVPLYASSDFAGKSKRGLYGDVIEELDWSVGEVLNALRKNDLDQKTIVLFTSDNGPWLAFDIEGGSAGSLREGKQTTFEGGQRVPAIFYWPGKIAPGIVNDDLALQLDIFPTFLKIAGGKNDKPVNALDGEDIGEVLFDGKKRKGNEFLYYSNGEVQAYRKGDWKIKLPYKGNKGTPGAREVAPHDTLLFNLRDDREEKKNVIAGHSAMVKELLQSLKVYASRLEGSPGTIPQRLPADISHIRKLLERHPEYKVPGF